MLKRFILSIALLSVFLSFGCLFPEEQIEDTTDGGPDEEGPAELPNPAAVNCKDLRYDYEIRTTEEGSVGYCMLDGDECEEWALYRGECCLTANDCDPRGCEGTMECIDTECTCVPEPEPEPEPEPIFETWEGNTEDIIDARADECNSLFYMENSGQFTVKYYRWAQGNMSNPPDQITIGIGGLENAVLFDDEPIRTIVAIGFRTYSPSDTFDECGVAIFNAQITDLDRYDTFSIDYRPGEPLESLSFGGCEITEKTNYYSGDDIIAVYEFICG